MRFARALGLFLAASWCGALLFFAGTAGLVLATSPSRHVGGAVNRALLDGLDLVSLAVAAALLVIHVAVHRERTGTRLHRLLVPRLLVVAAVAAIASRYLVTPEMVALRDRMGTIIDLVPKSDPLRQDWGRLHAISSILLLVRIAASALVFGLDVSQLSRGGSTLQS